MGSVRDRNIAWLRKRLYLPVTGFPGYSVDILVTGGQAAGDALQILPTGSDPTVIGKTTATSRQAVGAVAGTDRNARLRAIGNANPRLVPVVGANIDVQGLLLAAANDGVEFFGMIPYDVDITKPIGLRCWWTSEAAAVATRTITFRIRYGKVGAGAAIPAVTTALDTVITAQAPTGTAAALERGNRGVIDANKFVETDFFWGFEILMTAFDAAFTENKYLLGLEVDYVPRKTAGPGRAQDVDLLTNPFGVS